MSCHKCLSLLSFVCGRDKEKVLNFGVKIADNFITIPRKILFAHSHRV